MPTVSQKGQVTIPVAVREALGIHSGDEITFEATETGYVLRKQSADDRFEKWQGAISSEQTMRERMAELRGRPLNDQTDRSNAANDEGDATDSASTSDGGE